MSDFYNPESVLHEEFLRRLLDARRLRERLDRAVDPDEMKVIGRQLREVERGIEVMRHRLRPRPHPRKMVAGAA